MKKKIGVISLGCAKNLINTEQMMYLLSQAGFYVSGEVENTEAVIINTCGFIESAKSEAIETILEIAELKKAGKTKKLIVAGCLPQRYKENILDELPEIDAIVGTGSFDDIVEVVTNPSPSQGLRPLVTYFKDINAPVSEAGRIITTSPLWAYLKIAEGCDNRCAYCCIPDIRGSYRSRSMENIVAEAQKLADRGIKELILVAQDVTRYGLDLYGKYALAELLRALSNIENIMWLRLLYLYPDEINDQLIDEIVINDKIVRYLDIPVQHISDKILGKMNRRGTGLQIRKLFEKLRERIDGVVLRTSIITGLPGEEQEEFEELLEFLRDARIERVGVFTYSPEEGTPAASLERPDAKTAQKRAEIVQKLQSGILDDFNNSRLGTTTMVIDGRSYAEAPEVDGYILIEEDKNEKEPFECRITGVKDGVLLGKRSSI
ncbi:MAG: 30S ribosomal protein S12 methylthiotransferase RimO [Oscillospiraceae bacterium]|nr:30S ribosomal protein S12 methylthiotransferase RimO [Oscillospiraceae bacterium]